MIEGGYSKSVPIVQPFSRNEPEKISKFITQLTTALSAKGIPLLPVVGLYDLHGSRQSRQVMFAKNDDELNPIVQLTAIQEAQGYEIGDLSLS